MVKTFGVERRSVARRIQDSARSQFARYGYDGARVDEIAREAGINKATLYYQVGDKSALYHAVLAPLLDHVIVELTHKVGREPTAASRLHAYVGTLAHLLVQQRELAPLLLREVVAGGEHLTDELVRQLTQVNVLLRTVLNDGIESGEFRSIDALTLQSLIVGGLLFYAGAAPLRAPAATLGSHVALRAGTIPVHRLVSTVMDLVLRGITSSPTPGEMGGDDFESVLPVT